MSLSFAGLSLVLAVTLALGVTRGDGTCAITNPIASGFASTIAELSNNLPRDYVVTALSVHPGVMEKDVCRALRALLVLRPTLQRLQENVEERTLIYNSTRTLLSSLAFYGYVHFSGLPLGCTRSSSIPQRRFFTRLRSDMEAASLALDSSCPFDDPGRDLACGPPACPRHGEAGRAVDSAATARDSDTGWSPGQTGTTAHPVERTAGQAVPSQASLPPSSPSSPSSSSSSPSSSSPSSSSSSPSSSSSSSSSPSSSSSSSSGPSTRDLSGGDDYGNGSGDDDDDDDDSHGGGDSSSSGLVTTNWTGSTRGAGRPHTTTATSIANSTMANTTTTTTANVTTMANVTINPASNQTDKQLRSQAADEQLLQPDLSHENDPSLSHTAPTKGPNDGSNHGHRHHHHPGHAKEVIRTTQPSGGRRTVVQADVGGIGGIGGDGDGISPMRPSSASRTSRMPPTSGYRRGGGGDEGTLKKKNKTETKPVPTGWPAVAPTTPPARDLECPTAYHRQAAAGGGGTGGTLGTMLMLGLMSSLSSLLLGMLLGWLIARKQARSRKPAPQAPEGDPLRQEDTRC